jgi:hypothetical protein
MLHSTMGGKPHSGANERLIGGRNIEEDLVQKNKPGKTHLLRHRTEV